MKKQLWILLLALTMVFCLVAYAACDENPAEPTKYTLKYAANGGSGTVADESYAEGAEVTLKAANAFTAPEGKEFDGWLVDGAKKAAGDKIAMPAKDITVTAQWKNVTPPSVTLDKITATYYGTIEVGAQLDKSKLAVMAHYSDASQNKTVTGYTLGALDTSSAGEKTVTISYTEGGVTKTVDLKVTVVEVWVVTFKNGETVVSTVKVAKGQKLLLGQIPDAPADIPATQEFKGWFDGETQITVDTIISGNVTAVAKIEDKTVPVENWTVTFKNGENVVETVQVVKGQKLTAEQIPDAPAAPQGKEFDGWYIGEGASATKVTVDTAITGNVTANAKFVDSAPAVTPEAFVGIYDVVEDDEYNYLLIIALALDNKTLNVSWQPEDDDAIEATDVSLAIVEGKQQLTFVVVEGLGGGSEYYLVLESDGSLSLSIEGDTYEYVVSDHAEASQWTVTFNPNNAEEPETWTVKVDNGSVVAKPATDPTIESGKAFRYWADENGDEYDFATPVTADIELSAVYAWKVTFAAGEGATGSVEPVWIKMWSPLGITLPQATGLSNGDKVFAGWSDGATTYQPGDRFSGTGNVTLTAQWLEASSDYTLSFDVGSGEGTAPQAVQLAEGATTTLPDGTGISYEGRIFIGWSEGWKGTLLQAGSTYTMPNKNVTLQARWGIQITYKHGEHGTGADVVDVVDANLGKATLKAADTFTAADGYAFNGWQIVGGAEEDVYPAGDSLSVSQNVELVALWTEQHVALENNEQCYLILYPALECGYLDLSDEEQVWFSAEIVNSQLTVTLEDESSFKGIYDDAGLYIAITYGGKTYTFGTNQSIADYQGYWLGEISFNYCDYVYGWIDGNKIYLKEETYAADSYEIKLNRSGSKLVATFTVSSYEVTVTFNSDNEIAIVAKHKFYGSSESATFTKTALYNITYAVDASVFETGTAAPEAPAIDKVVGGRKATAPELAEIRGYRFLGWFAPDANEAFDFNTAISADITLTARWEKIINATVTFSIGNATDVVAPQAQQVPFEGKASVPDAASMAREGFRFDGWFLNGEKYDFDSQVVKDITLSAKWTVQYTVTYVRPEGVTGDIPENETVYEGDKYEFKTSSFVMEGYDFLGWKIGAGDALYVVGPSNYTVYNDLQLTPVFGTLYTNVNENDSIKTVILRTDSEKAYVGNYKYEYTYSKDTGLLVFPNYDGKEVTLIINEDNTFIQLDELAGVKFDSTTDGIQLVLDGKGGATLGENTQLTYELVYEENYFTGKQLVGIKLTIGDNTTQYALSKRQLGYNEYVITLNATITVDGTTYVFGSGSTPA